MMDEIIYQIKNQVYETFILIQNFFRAVNLSLLLLAFASAYLIFMRKWEFKKIISFLFQICVFFIIFVRAEAWAVAKFGTEAQGFAISVGRIVFLTITIIVFIYHAAIKD